MNLKNSSRVEETTRMLQKFSPAVELEKHYGNESQYLLPFHISSKFPDIFNALDLEKEKLCIQTYGLSMTSMVEIFLHLTENTQDGFEQNSENFVSPSETKELLEKISKPITILTGNALLKSQFRGAFHKCRLHACRNWQIICMQLLLPALMVFFSIIQILAIPKIGHQPVLDISLNAYKDMSGLEIKVPFTANNEAFSMEIMENIFENDAEIEILPS